MPGPTRDFWQSKFDSGHTPWDRGASSPQLAAWLADATLTRRGEPVRRVAVPGCGAGYEVAVLAGAGFDVTGIDYVHAAVQRTRERLQAAGLDAAVVEADVLTWQPEALLDAVYEQTCLCALHPDDWVAYARQLQGWLRPGGLLLALVMQAPREGAASGHIEGPPYHVDIHAMRALFPSAQWHWPKPPYARVQHPRGWGELALVLQRC